MTHARFTSRAEAQTYVALCARARGYPERGTHRGDGRHIELTDTPGPGWTLRFADVVEHPDGDEWAVRALQPDARSDARLTGPERATLSSRFAGRSPLGSDWTPRDNLGILGRTPRR